ncbi:MAG: formate--tetrahydrofolate ligase [Armatimonadetes bacterium]|nr:formate--tetrahydrofolate ligase [Armatimonadota bacterium]
MADDLSIARAATLLPITEVASRLGLRPDELEQYGDYKAKVKPEALARRAGAPAGKLILMTAMTPTPAGEGKTTLSIGLAQGLARLGRRACVALREPSLGPVFGVKGGATGGGYSQVLPMEDINLHFTGDIHAVTTAHNLLAALADNHLQQGNPLGLDPRRMVFPRVLDLCDRALRSIVLGLGGPGNGVPREGGFEITAASEVMAILALASDLPDLRVRLGRIVVGYTTDGRPVTAQALEAPGAMMATLREAFKPNLVQTIEGVPAFVHAGPFGNVGPGVSSVQATRLGLQLAEFLVTEAGFGSDLGAEKFLDIKCRHAGLTPNAVVVGGTIRALKYQAGKGLNTLAEPDVAAVEAGIPNLEKHVENMQAFGLPVGVALNRFTTDSPEEIAAVATAMERRGVPLAVADIWARGGEGGRELAEMVVELSDQPTHYRPLYDLDQPVKEKIAMIATRMYGAEGVVYTAEAEKRLREIEANGYANLAICMAKTQNSLSDQSTLRGRPTGFQVTIRDLKVFAGAGYLVAYAGNILTMPGLPKEPAAARINLDDHWHIEGLF